MCRLRLSKIPFGAFRQVFAVCCAHNLFAVGEQIPHLQPEKCFRPRTRRGRKRFELYLLLMQQTLRGFFYTLRRHIKVPPVSSEKRIYGHPVFRTPVLPFSGSFCSGSRFCFRCGSRCCSRSCSDCCSGFCSDYSYCGSSCFDLTAKPLW